jgi:hypothetical protein
MLFINKKLWRYQNPYIEEEQTTQLQKKKYNDINLVDYINTKAITRVPSWVFLNLQFSV